MVRSGAGLRRQTETSFPSGWVHTSIFETTWGSKNQVQPPSFKIQDANSLVRLADELDELSGVLLRDEHQ